MAGRLDGKVAVITGGASGIGKATAELFVAEGAKVVVADLQETAGEKFAASHRGDIEFVHTDVTKEDDVRAMIACAIDAFGRLDILFNNAGAAERDYRFEEITPEAFDKVMHLHVMAAMLGIKHAVPVMREQGGGAIVTTSSVAGVMANVGPVLYSIAKAAIVQMSQVAAVRLAHENIRVNCVNPGVIPTPIFGRAFGLDAEESAALEPRVREMAKTFQPLPRAGDVSDIAEAVLYLAADSGRFVTGETLIVDGGLVRGPAPDPEGGVFKAFADALGLDIAKARNVK